MYKCLSCGWKGEKAEMGYCPKCGRDSLMVIEVKCPFCGQNLGISTKCDIDSVGWCCDKCNVKIYWRKKE